MQMFLTDFNKYKGKGQESQASGNSVISNRREYKYLIPADLLDVIRNELRPHLIYDSFAGKRVSKEYSVRSIYLDTIDFKHYYEKVQGLKIRKKFRIRGYNTCEEDSKVFFEIKRKYDNFISKNRSSTYFANLEPMLRSGDFESLILNGDKEIVLKDANHFFYYYYRESLRPLILIVYEREAYYSKFDPKFRISFDKNLRSKDFPEITDLYNDDVLSIVNPNFFILEVKFSGSYPSWMKDIFTKYNIKRRSVSKYNICLDFHKIYRPKRSLKKYETRFIFHKNQ